MYLEVALIVIQVKKKQAGYFVSSNAAWNSVTDYESLTEKNKFHKGIYRIDND